MQEKLDKKEVGQMRKLTVDVDGEQVFTCGWVMDQMGALTSSIDRLRAKNRFLAFISVVSLLMSIFAILTR